MVLKKNEPHNPSSLTVQSYSQWLMKKLEEEKRIDFVQNFPNPIFSTNNLFSPKGGQMFGVMKTQDVRGNFHFHRAFSGQYNGEWIVPGWVPPLFNPEDFKSLVDPVDKQIKKMGKAIQEKTIQSEYIMGNKILKQGLSKQKNPDQLIPLIANRKKLSRELSIKIFDLYILPNFKGEKKPLREFFQKLPPYGTGDCCAPKLLAFAALNNLQPLSIAEFFWGKTNPSKTKEHQQFYPPCKTKCEPILGFMLKGLNLKGESLFWTN